MLRIRSCDGQLLVNGMEFSFHLTIRSINWEGDSDSDCVVHRVKELVSVS